MGNWMTYQRMRQRNNLMFRKPDDDPDPYIRGDHTFPTITPWLLIGDMNRMERDYISPDNTQQHTKNAGPDPATLCAEATGIPLEDVQAVLRYVFLEQT